MQKSLSYSILILKQQFFFEIEIKKYLKTFNDIEKLEGFYVLPKSFVRFSLEKKTEKMPQNEQV